MDKSKERVWDFGEGVRCDLNKLAIQERPSRPSFLLDAIYTEIT